VAACSVTSARSQTTANATAEVDPKEMAGSLRPDSQIWIPNPKILKS